MSTNKPIKEDQMQAQIMQAAKQLFAVHGLSKVTMDDVAKAIGKGRSSLYYYYKSKDEIFDAVINIEISEMLDAMAAAAEKASTVEDKINALFVTKLKVGREKGSFFNPLEAGMDADALSNFQKAKIIHHNIIMKKEGLLLTRILNDGISSGELSDIKAEDMDTMIFVLLSCLHGIKREMRMESDLREIEPAVSQLVRVMMHGLKK